MVASVTVMELTIAVPERTSVTHTLTVPFSATNRVGGRDTKASVPESMERKRVGEWLPLSESLADFHSAYHHYLR